jgi:hypothetical protein
MAGRRITGEFIRRLGLGLIGGRLGWGGFR